MTTGEGAPPPHPGTEPLWGTQGPLVLVLNRCRRLWGGASVTALAAPRGDWSGGRALRPPGLISDAARGAQPGGAEGLEPPPTGNFTRAAP